MTDGLCFEPDAHGWACAYDSAAVFSICNHGDKREMNAYSANQVCRELSANAAASACALDLLLAPGGGCVF